MNDDIRINKEFPILNEDNEPVFDVNSDTISIVGTLSVDITNEDNLYKVYIDNAFMGEFDYLNEAVDAVEAYFTSYKKASDSVLEELQDYLD